MNGGWIPVAIVAIVMFAMVMKSRYKYLQNQSSAPVQREDSAESTRLKDEVRQLKERIHVLERIAVEKEDTLSRQIEQLRDR
ncbi:hypothetical protein [Sphingomonas sp. LY160]|uniref:hypothetical protein n=1 Tax=Sphingomonas sp. LY160 TaxID=3095342 RepID=UPI002ADEB96F|nr:hypothetical protein [Sphingomonas sp. LY160]MEA1071277.1 hypothetical protein [Sphingomonas sp. LY160]